MPLEQDTQRAERGDPLKDVGQAKLVDGVLVPEAEQSLWPEERDELLKRLSIAFPGRRVVVLEGGMRVSRHEQMDRIEAKLDRLLSALAEDEQDDEQGHDLEGNPLPQPRDPHEPL